jgi:hypothetical protein
MARQAGPRDRRQIERIPKGRRAAIGREEYNRLIDILNERGDMLNQLRDDESIQFQRIAQIQAELDRIKQALARLIPLPGDFDPR